MTVGELFSLKGRVAVVSGGARNFGYYFSQALAEAGAVVHLTSRLGDDARRSAEVLARETGGEVHGHELDPLEEDAVRAFFSGLGDQGCGILVNNAGGRPEATTPINDYAFSMENHPLGAWRGVLDAYLTTAFLMSKHALPAMRRNRQGSIIFIASISGMIGRDRQLYRPYPDHNANCVDYSAAKAGMLGLMRDLGAQVGGEGIRVNAISPGGFERGHLPGFVSDYGARTTLGRMGDDTADLKGAIVFLASDASRYVTGHNLVVDGGFVSNH